MLLKSTGQQWLFRTIEKENAKPFFFDLLLWFAHLFKHYPFFLLWASYYLFENIFKTPKRNPVSISTLHPPSSPSQPLSIFCPYKFT